MVEDQKEDVLGGGSAQDVDTEKGALFQVEGSTRQLSQLFLELGIAVIRNILDGEPFVLPAGQFVQIEEADRGLLVHDDKGGPQRLLSGDDAPKCPTEGVDVKLRAAPIRLR